MHQHLLLIFVHVQGKDGIFAGNCRFYFIEIKSQITNCNNRDNCDNNDLVIYMFVNVDRPGWYSPEKDCFCCC